MYNLPHTPYLDTLDTLFGYLPKRPLFERKPPSAVSIIKANRRREIMLDVRDWCRALLRKHGLALLAVAAAAASCTLQTHQANAQLQSLYTNKDSWEARARAAESQATYWETQARDARRGQVTVNITAPRDTAAKTLASAAQAVKGDR